MRSILTIALLLINSCAVSAPEVSEGPSAATLPQDKLAEPSWVLDGTDLLPFADVPRVVLPAQPTGKYKAEQGGAEIYLSISGSTADTWVVSRTFQEPGLIPDSKIYQARRQGSVLISSNGNLIIQGTKVGVLVLELESGVDSIPASYWIHYVRGH